MRFGTPSLPRSWSRPARRTSKTAGAGRPRRAARPSATSAARRECEPVYGLLASTMSANAPAIRSMSSSSEVRTQVRRLERQASGRRGPARSGRRARPRRTRSSSASAMSGSYQVPRRAARTLDGRGSAAQAHEDVQALARARGSARADGSSAPRQAARLAAAVPVLVEVHGSRPTTSGSKPALRAIAAPRSQRTWSDARATRARPLHPDRDEPADPGRQWLVGGQRSHGQDARTRASTVRSSTGAA